MELPFHKGQNIMAINTNLSYFRLRKLIGFLGLLLIFAPLIANEPLHSISHSYYSPAGILFISTLAICGSFLITYKGPSEPKLPISDNLLTWLAGISLLLVAFVPTSIPNCWDESQFPNPVCTPEQTLEASVHFGAAAIFFFLMGYMSIFRFPMGTKPFDAGKKFRNGLYRFCGIVMWAVLAFAGLSLWQGWAEQLPNFVYWVEVPLLALFGISWLVKGKALADIGLQKEKKGLSDAELRELSVNVMAKIKSMEDGRKMLQKIDELSLQQ